MRFVILKTRRAIRRVIRGDKRRRNRYRSVVEFREDGPFALLSAENLRRSRDAGIIVSLFATPAQNNPR